MIGRWAVASVARRLAPYHQPGPHGEPPDGSEDDHDEARRAVAHHYEQDADDHDHHAGDEDRQHDPNYLARPWRLARLFVGDFIHELAA
jgi:hypothetical protein